MAAAAVRQFRREAEREPAPTKVPDVAPAMRPAWGWLVPRRVGIAVVLLLASTSLLNLPILPRAVLERSEGRRPRRTQSVPVAVQFPSIGQTSAGSVTYLTPFEPMARTQAGVSLFPTIYGGSPPATAPPW